MGKETFGSGMAQAARQSQKYAQAEVELWYVRVRGKLTVAECREVEKFRICLLPGEAISKSIYLGDDPDLLAANPEIEFLRMVPDYDDLVSYGVDSDLAD